ncbi:MAG: hypothetical protein AAF004_13445 [Pseudomonadota bacterium]
MKSVIRAVVSAVLLFAVVSNTTAQQMPEDAQAWMDALKTVDIVTFDDGDMQGLLKTAQALDDAGLEELTSNDASPNSLTMIGDNAEAMTILKANGYSADKFSTHVMNLALAMGASEMLKNKDEMDAAVAQLEAMKGQLPAEQYAFMRDQLVGVMDIFARAPDSNIALAAKYQAQFEAIGSDD